MFNGSSSASTLFTATAVIELGAGLALLTCPSATAVLLVGAPLEASASLDRGARRRCRVARARRRLLACAR